MVKLLKMNLAEMAQLEYVILETLVKNGQKAPMVLENTSEFVQDLSDGDFFKCANKWKNVLERKDLSEFQSAKDFTEFVDRIFGNSDLNQRWEIFGIAVSCLQVFVQINFLGKSEIIEVNQRPKWLDEYLVLDGDALVPVVKNLELFAFAKSIFDQRDLMKTLTTKWWKFRFLWLHQELLDEKSEEIFKQSKELLEAIDLEALNDEGKIHFHLEVATFNLNYFDINLVKDKVNAAANLAGISIEETGALGKRTKFQQKEVAQLTLDITKAKLDAAQEKTKEQNLDLPIDLKLEDEVRLDKIAFSQERKDTSLTLTQSAILLAQYYLLKRLRPRDSLMKEELMPYLDAILTNHEINWCLKSVALLERSKLEKDENRGVERALMQIQTLVDNLSKNGSFDRLNLFYSCKPPPFWLLEYELVQVLISVGSIKTALDHALKLQLWEEVINCYHLLELRHKAEEVIRNQIAKEGESPLLLCMLGDATDNPEHYEDALKLSKGKSSRALRSLGTFYFQRKDYEKAVDYLGKSLAINSFQLKILLRHGYAAMELEKWDIAAQSYRNYCTFESDNFEAWNNLANAYIKMGQKPRAWKVLQEAVKCDYDNWKVWDNILIVSTDCAHFEEVIRAYHRILDLRSGKHVDCDVLSILVKAIAENLPDNYERPSRAFKKPALALFGRLSSENGGESRIWELYSQLVLVGDELSQEDAFKAAQYMQKATASFMQNDKNWCQTSQKLTQGLKLAQIYIKRCLGAADLTTNPTQNIQQMSSAKMTTKSMLSKVKQSQMDELNDDIKLSVKETHEALETLVKAIEELKSK